MYQVDVGRLAEIAQCYDLDLVAVFGSQVTGHARPGADIDVAVRMRHRHWDDWERDLALIGELVEAITGDGDLDVVFLNGASPLLLFEVARSGVLCYEAEPGIFLQFQSYAARRYDDSRKFFELQAAYLREKYGDG